MKQKITFLMLWLLMISSYNNIYGQREKEKGQRMNNMFEYEDCACAVKIELIIYNGLEGMYGGQMVMDKINKGAVTIANLNNTDGDNLIDNVDDIVVSGLNGRDEVDLMKLEIKSTGKIIPSCPDLELVLQGPIKLWQKKTKEIQQSNIIPIASLPITIWVEATDHSTSVRDISITANVAGVFKDEVKATAVWVDFVRKYKIKASSGIENSSAMSLRIINPTLRFFIDNVIPNILTERYGLGETAVFNPLNYSGSCPTGNYTGRNSGYSANILTEYEVFPNDLRAQALNLGVKFDFARQVDSDEEIIFQSDYRWRDSPDVIDEIYNNGIEGSNDDDGNDDEDLTITSTNKLYSFDAPGFIFDAYFNPKDLMGRHIAYWKRDLNFKEFVRISFDQQPIGDGIMVQGSRGSDYLDWNTDYNAVRTALTGVSDPYLACNHVYAQVNTSVSHSAILRFFGTGTPKINLNLLPNAADAVYQFRYDQPLNRWSLLRSDSSGNTTLGPFNYIPDPSNPTIGKWILLDPTKVQIEIESSSTLMNQDGFRFVVNKSPVNNSLN